MQKRAVLFDLDGTLVDSLPGIEASVDLCLAECNAPARKCDLRPLIGPPIRAILHELVPEADDQQLSRLEERFRCAYNSEGWRKTLLHEHVSHTLTQLSAAGLPLFLVTNKPQIPTHQILSTFGIVGLFTDIVCRDTKTPPFQSKKEMLLHCVHAHGLSAGACLYVGDSSEDYRAAREAGIPVVLVAHGYGALQPEVAGCAVVNTLSQLLNTIGITEVA